MQRKIRETSIFHLTSPTPIGYVVAIYRSGVIFLPKVEILCMRAYQATKWLRAP